MKKDKLRLPSEILESRPELTEVQNGVLKGLIGIIPYIGTMLNEILFEIPNRIHQARLNETIQFLKEKVGKLESSAIKDEYLRSEDFFDFTRNMFENSIKIKSNDKRRFLANVYINSIVDTSNYDFSTYRLFMDFIVQLSPIQINIFKFIEKNTTKLKYIETYTNFYELYIKENDSIQLDRYEFKFYCNDLENKALISCGDGLEDFLSTSSRLVLGDHIKASVVITSLGNQFIEFLNE